MDTVKQMEVAASSIILCRSRRVPQLNTPLQDEIKMVT